MKQGNQKKTTRGRRKREIDLDRVRHLAKLGLRPSQIAAAMGIPTSTFDDRRKSDPDLVSAIGEGQGTGLEAVLGTIFDSALAGNQRAARLYLGRFDKQDRDEMKAEIEAELFAEVSRMAAIRADKRALEAVTRVLDMVRDFMPLENYAEFIKAIRMDED